MRVPVSELVKVITRALRYYGTTAFHDPSHPLSAATTTAQGAEDSLPRCFSVALSLLSMQMDLLDTLLQGLSSGASGPDVNQDVSEQRTEFLRQKASFADQLTELWAALLVANGELWLRLSAFPDLGAEQEEAMRSECWLFAAVASAVSDAAGGLLREELIPAEEERGNGGRALLQSALDASGLCGKQLGADGEIEELAAGKVNQRLVHVIKVCVGMALCGNQAEQQ